MYLLMVLMQCIAVTYLFYLIGGLVAFGIGAYVFGIKAAKEVQMGLDLLNIKLKIKDPKESLKFMSIFVHYHSILKQLSFVWDFLLEYLSDSEVKADYEINLIRNVTKK